MNTSADSTIGEVARGAKFLGIFPALALGLSLVLPDAVTAEETFGQDPWITTQAKIALLTSDDVSAIDVNVDTVNGMVTLHGKVPTDHVKERAGGIAKQVDGVRSVRNLLQVVPPAEREEVDADDDAIAIQVEKAIENDPSLKDSDISVESVNDGVVLLAGRASSLAGHLEAINVAGRVDGVRRVASEITSENRLYDVGIWNEGAVKQAQEGTEVAVIDDVGEVTETERTTSEEIAGAAMELGDAASEAAVTTGNAIKDAWITSATKALLVADGTVDAMDVNVDTRDGVVTLFGTVESIEAKRAAEANARSVAGVRDVRNEIRIAINEKREVKQTSFWTSE